MKQLLVLSMLITGAPAFAQDAAVGAVVYTQYCATCHGVDATGNGPMAPSLLVQPTNLTQLAANNEDVFPTARVVSRIDGRDPLVSHGSDMPIWGPYFEETQSVPLRAETGQPILTSQSIADLVVFLQEIQG